MIVERCICTGEPHLYEVPGTHYAMRCYDCLRLGKWEFEKERAVRAWNHEMRTLKRGILNEEAAKQRIVH